MVPPPPPPPPGPPPLPGTPFSSTSSGQQRDQLLQSIRQGTKLKKTVTIDKSGPFIAGKIPNINNNTTSESSRDLTSSSSTSKQINLNGGPPGLANLFAGGIPKLKPTGLGKGSTGREGSSVRSLSSETKNRGPPPQPPPANYKPQIPSSASDSVLTSSNPTNNLSLRANNAPGNLPSKPPVGGYGKPNVAPKPPVAKDSSSLQISHIHQQYNSVDGAGSEQNESGKPSPPPKKISLNGRSGVNRAHSMRVPKSPPVAPTTSPPFPPNCKQNLVRNQSNLHQSQDGLNGRIFNCSKTGTLPHNFQKLALYPPNIPPPPAPSQRTPTRPPVTKPPPPPFRPAPPPAPPPPPPPHRSSPAPPPPPQARIFASAMSSSVPPPPPVRNLSVRNGSLLYQTDIENKFGHLFHNIQDLPGPSPFRNLVKTYNTRASAIGKQPAPPPPVPPSSMQLGNKIWINSSSHC
ncbi:hypothetical protein RUM43_014145 [Polyplax serrata]|uniref:WH2 domain-containing protein n=1 Tax=Polyplax serrata TaxID=468196 RepID=A0AAN8PBN5_POLSC